jgi:glycosyltransferase 2 family protein
MNNKPKEHEDFEKEHAGILKSLNVRKIILPLLIGVGVIGFLFWKQFDLTEFQRIKWTNTTLVWVGLAIILLIIRHLAYAARLYTVSKKQFTYLKCVELIFIWEFSSAVTPTAVGGSAVALFFLSQEKLPLARTTAVVIYTVVLDTFFFVLFLPLLVLVLGPEVIRPGIHSYSQLDSMGSLFLFTWLIKLTYGSVFIYGLLIQPFRMKQVLDWATRFGFLRRFRPRALALGEEFVMASHEIRSESRDFHWRAIMFTVIPWVCKFALMVFLVNGIAPDISLHPSDQLIMFGRMACMYVIMLVSPTPGGSGFAEFAFGDFLTDYMPMGIAVIVATIWRLLAYYSYLFIGAMVVPAWLSRLIRNRFENRNNSDDDTEK